MSHYRIDWRVREAIKMLRLQIVDIRAIAIGQSNDDKTVLDIIGVAHGPGEIDSACALISDLICVSSTSLRTEKLPARWKYEALFARANASKNLSRPLKP